MADAFRQLRYDLDGATLQRLTPAGAEELGPAVAAMQPWSFLGWSPDTMTKALLKTSDAAHPFELRYESELAGLVIICEPWLAGPYLQRFAILPAFQGCGLGNRVLNWMESEARAMSARQMWLCVSDFNHQARRLYEGFGFKLVARLEKLVSDSADELLMRKMLID